MPDMLRRFWELSATGRKVRIEREAIEHLKTFSSTKDNAERTRAWEGLMKCADELVKIEKGSKVG